MFSRNGVARKLLLFLYRFTRVEVEYIGGFVNLSRVIVIILINPEDVSPFTK